ncbi:hypothetical protein JK363_13000 [Streptomyces sp. 205]|uniref:MDMPI C-terminal domain-containing protein n=1 Tax=Streptomyces coffeae TaxID=621382 RepID=A0ABS1NCA0_9ACTN|nr:hypothetical protein [Streptomyces coffeae]MBL1097584.1 hypothetical protein [Streptomyces coffeae]
MRCPGCAPTSSTASSVCRSRWSFRRADGPEVWSVRFEGDDIRLTEHTGPAAPDEPCDVELTATASDLMLFRWQRLPADRLASVTGNRAVLDRYFTLVPPV